MMDNRRQYNGELGINSDSFRVLVTEYSRLPREVLVSIDKFISPERGIDYWTIQDQLYIIDLVISKIPKQEGGSVKGYLYNGVFYKDPLHLVVIEGEEEKIYVELLTNKMYRWNNGSYIEISPSLTIGETSDTAFAGNRGVVLENEILDKIEYEGLNSPSIDNIAVFGDSEGNIKDSLIGINDIALDNEVVHISGNEIINGLKFFSSEQTFNDGVIIKPYLVIGEKNSTVTLSCDGGSLLIGEKYPVIIENVGLPKEKYDAANMEYVDTKYEKPNKGIPYEDLDSVVLASLNKADSAIQKESDPTVPRWAKEKNKPLYDYREIQNTPDLSGFITNSVNDLTNYYLKSETYTKTEVLNLIAAIQQFHYEIYAALPQTGENNVLYLIGPTGSGSDKYEEYVYSNNTFNKIGDTSIDLSGYVTTQTLGDYTPTSLLANVAISGSYNDLSDKPLITPELVEMSYGESNAWTKFIDAYNAKCIVYCRASSNSNPASGSQTRKAFLAYVNNETTPTEVEFQYYRSVSTHSDSQQGDQVFVYKLTPANGGTWTVTTRNAFTKVVAGANMSSSYSNGTITLNASIPVTDVTVGGTSVIDSNGVAVVPDIPNSTSDLTNDGSDGTSTYVEADELATVATTGDYDDLANTPTYALGETTGGPASLTVSLPYGFIDSTSTATDMTATVNGITELRDGVTCIIVNKVVGSASGVTLNVNGLGAKPIHLFYDDSEVGATFFAVDKTCMFVYDSTLVTGGCWKLFYPFASTSSTYNAIRTYYTSLPSATACGRYRLLFTSFDGTKYVPANTSTSTSATTAKTPTTEKIDPFGKIVFYNYTTTRTAGQTFGVTYQYLQGSFALGYSFNTAGAALTLTVNKPVYIVCSPQNDGSAIIDVTTPYTQDLPTTEDGKIYIYLGIARSATQVEMIVNHPVYYFKSGQRRLWTNQI